MTMHLARGLSTINTKQPKTKKLTKAKEADLREELRIYNRDLKRQGRHDERMSFEQYVDLVFGRTAKPSQNPLANFKPLQSRDYSYRRGDTSHIPSLNCSPAKHTTARNEPQRYTGERRLIGIATMHKSNMVPVFEDDKQYAKDLARMRR